MDFEKLVFQHWTFKNGFFNIGCSNFLFYNMDFSKLTCYYFNSYKKASPPLETLRTNDWYLAPPMLEPTDATHHLIGRD